MLSGSPSRSRGPGNSSRKKSASRASKHRKPLGTILRGWLSEGGVAAVEAVPDRLDGTAVEAGCKTGLAEGEPSLVPAETGGSARKSHRSSARSLAVK